MKALFILALALLALVTALSTGWELMFRLAYTMLAALFLSAVWAWGNVRWLRFRYELKTARAQVGGNIEERLSLENSSWLPKLWLEIRDRSTLSGHRGNRVISLGSYARRIYNLVTPCHVRGEFDLGPITVVSGDPFGLFKRQRTLKVGGKVLVYPAIAPLPSFGRLPGELPGGSAQEKRSFHTTTNAAGVREYQQGDSLSRIHWLSSARQRRLMSKEFELDPLSDVWIILDMDREVQAGTGQDSTEECAVSAAATLVNYFVGMQREVGVITQERVLTTDRGQRQLQKALELLAVVHAGSSMPLEELVVSEELRFSRGATAVIVTPSADENWLSTCRLLAARGVSVVAVLLEASTFGSRQSSLLLVSSLAVQGIPTYLIKRGDDLSLALARPATGRM